MAWPTSSTVASGATITAAGRNALRSDLLAINGFVRKTADQSVTSSTVLTNDTHLLYTIGATGTYKFEIALIALSAADAAGDIKFALTFPTGTLTAGMMGLTTALTTSVIGDTVNAGVSSAVSGTQPANFSAGLSASECFILIKGLLVATATGTLRLQWAQLASSGSATTLKAGSFMEVQQVA